MGIFITLLGLSVVIFIHEMGHLIAAKRAGIGVFEFAVGMGPKLASRKFGSTIYSLRLLPLGGFVKLAGMDSGDKNQDDFPEEMSFQKKSIWDRFCVLFAGSLMNVILGYVMFLILFLSVGVPRLSPVIQSVIPDMPAAVAGVQPNDELVALNGNKIIDVKKDFIDQIQTLEKNVPVNIMIQRNNETFLLVIKPEYSDKNQKKLIGVGLSQDFTPLRPIASIAQAGVSTVKSMQLLWLNIKLMSSGTVSMKDLSGPIGIVQVASHQLNTSITAFVQLMAFISITLGIMNLLPIPVLDGGHYPL